jgi:hypothetical protein
MLYVFYSSAIYIQYIQAPFSPVLVQQIMLNYFLGGGGGYFMTDSQSVSMS